MKTIFVLISVVFMLMVGACDNPEATMNTLNKAGYTNIVTTGYEMFGCAEDDTYSTGFCADNPIGHRVCGVVCCGAFGKGCTIRF